MITQIILGKKGYLDVTDDVDVPLTFAAANIRDALSKKQGGYSKTISLPNTPNNHKTFGFIFDVNVVDGTFNQNLRQECSILQRGVSVFEGYLQLKNVTKKSPSLENPDEQVTYEVLVKDETGDFFSSIADEYLTDLDLDWSQYDHIYTINSITATSAHTYQNIYKYFLNYNLKNEYSLQDFQPAIFGKVYVDQIFKDKGYSYSWANASYHNFDKTYIPYNGDKPLPNLSLYGFRAGIQNQVNSYTWNYYGQPVFANLPNSINNQPIIFDNDTTAPNVDSGNTYNTTTGKWTSGYFGKAEAKVRFKYEVYWSSPIQQKFIPIIYNPFNVTATTVSYGGCNLGVEVKNHIGDLATFQDLAINTFSAPTLVDMTQYPSTYTAYTISSGLTLIDAGLTPEFSVIKNVIPGDQLQTWIEGGFPYTQGNWVTANYVQGLKIGFSGQPGNLTAVASGNSFVPKVVVKISPIVDYQSNYFQVVPTAELGEGMTIRLNDFIPGKYKQKQLLADYSKIYNWYFSPDPNNSKKIIIETRDEFYDNGDTKDWTEKFVNAVDAKLEFLPDLQSKKIQFTYKQDKDVYNVDYFTQSLGEVYGQLDYTFENEFVKGVQTIGPEISPTPLNENGFGLVVPTINSAAPKTNVRLLYDCGWIQGPTGTEVWKYKNTGATNASIYTFGTYPCGSHFYPSPYAPTEDLNYGQTDFLYYDSWANTTNNNLYNRFWKRYINQIETGKLLTAYIQLNENDIANLNLRDKIYIHDSYWFINRIIDYNTNSKDGLTQVELINIDEGTKFTPFTAIKKKGYIKPTGPIKQWVGNEATFTNRFANNTFGGQNELFDTLGEQNIIQKGSKHGFLAGNDNDILGQKTFVFGDKNTLKGSNMFIFGVTGGTFTNSNTFNVASEPVVYINKVDAGRDEILNPFSLTKINFINAGRDAIRNIGSESIINFISAGRDSIL